MKKKEDSFKEFVSEAEEILENLTQNLLDLESTPDRSGIRPEIINTIFRGAHSLKGMSAMVGLKKVSELSHALEDLLDGLRMGRLALSDRVVGALMKSVEMVRHLVSEVNSGKGEKLDIAPVLDQLRQATQAEPEPGKPTGLEQTGLDPELLKVLTEYETHRLMENIKSGTGLFEISARFGLESFDRDLAKLSEQIQPLGEIISTLPSSGMSPDEGIGFNLIVGSKNDKETLSRKLSGSKVQIREIEGKGQASEGTQAWTEPEAGGSIRSITPTVRVDIGRLDVLLNVVGELVVTKGMISQIARGLVRESRFSAQGMDLQNASQMLERRLAELQEGLIDVRMIPIGQVFDRLVRIVRKLSRELSKEVDLQISGEDTRLDKSMIEDIADPLMHLIRNSMDHGIESADDRRQAGKPEVGIIGLRAMQRGNNVVIEVRDDGRGINLPKVYKKGVENGILDPEKEYSRRDIINVLFTPGFSTADQVTEVSGRGVGLDVVAGNITKLSGMIDVETEEGEGTTFSITLPITLVIIKALIVQVGGETFAIPVNSVSESLMIEPGDIRTIEGREVIQLREHTLGLKRLDEMFGLPAAKNPERHYVIVVGLAEKRLGLVVDAIQGQQEIVIKSLGDILRDGTPGIAGATELGNRKTILVIDPGALIEESYRASVAIKAH
jgi:two-component system chemotaxis sensor kinase CheA